MLPVFNIPMGSKRSFTQDSPLDHETEWSAANPLVLVFLHQSSQLQFRGRKNTAGRKRTGVPVLQHIIPVGQVANGTTPYLRAGPPTIEPMRFSRAVGRLTVCLFRAMNVTQYARRNEVPAAENAGDDRLSF